MSILISITESEMERIEKRRAWPIPLLAEIISCHPTSLYRMIKSGIIRSEGRPARILTESIRDARQSKMVRSGWFTVRAFGGPKELNFQFRTHLLENESRVIAGERALREHLVQLGYGLDVFSRQGADFVAQVSSLYSKARAEIRVTMR